jgi:predicted DNA-binding ribbon-helix-helix protein
MLGWTVRELARRSIVSIATIHAIEDTNFHSSYRQGDLAAIQAALEDGGIEFTNGDDPGVKLKAKPTGKGERWRASVAKSPVRKRSAKIGRHQTSISVEDEFWEGLKEVARERELPLNTLITDIHKRRQHANLSSVIRLFVLDHYRKLVSRKINDQATK